MLLRPYANELPLNRPAPSAQRPAPSAQRPAPSAQRPALTRVQPWRLSALLSLLAGLTLLVACDKDQNARPESHDVVLVRETPFGSISAINGTLVLERVEVLHAIAQEYVAQEGRAFDWPITTYAEAYHSYIQELDALDVQPERYDENLVAVQPDDGEYWFKKIVEVGLFAEIMNPQRTFVVGDSAYTYEVGRLDVRQFDRQTGLVEGSVLNQYPISISYRSQELAQRQDFCPSFFNRGGRCPGTRLRHKLREVNTFAICALEAVTESEYETRRNVFSGCKWVQTSADTIRHNGTLTGNVAGSQSGMRGGPYSLTRLDTEDITTPVFYAGLCSMNGATGFGTGFVRHMDQPGQPLGICTDQR